MNIPTGEFRALTVRAATADEYRRHETVVLIKTIAALVGEPDPLEQESRPTRPQLRVIEGGRQ